MNGEDPEQRIADLERQLADARRIAELERQLAEARRAAQPQDRRPQDQRPQDQPPPRPRVQHVQSGAWASVNGPPSAAREDPWAVARVVGLATEIANLAAECQRTGADWHEALTRRMPEIDRLKAESGLPPMRFQELWSRTGEQVARTLQFGGSGGYDATGRPDTTLAPAPRKVPFAFWLAELIPFRWPYVFTVVMVGIVAFSAVTWFLPVALPFIAVATVAGVYAYQLRGMATRTALLKWGEVARVIGARIVSQGTYYSGVTWGNAPLPIAHGWKVIRPVYSGPNTTTEVRYTIGGRQKTLQVSGREYIDGVILADPRTPERALCVTSFTYDLDRDPSGNWVGKLRTRLVVGMVSWVVVVALFLGSSFAVAYFEDDMMAWLCDNANTSGVDCSQYE